jgi:hypothetical protein
MDQGVVAHYEFCDATSASRQIINDTMSNMKYTVEYYKELEEKDDEKDQFISRWSAQIKVSGLNSSDITGYPIFYIAKEGAAPGELDYLTVNYSQPNNFYKVSH